jgi:hypothetical protein
MFDLFVDFAKTKNRDVVQIQESRLISDGDGIMQLLEVMVVVRSR